METQEILDLEAWQANPVVMHFINWVLDKRDRKGRFPNTVTYRKTETELRSLDRFLPPVARRTKSGGRIVIHLQKVQAILEVEANDSGRPAPDLQVIFDRLAGRSPRNLFRERDTWCAVAKERIEEGIAEGRRRAIRAGGPEVGRSTQEDFIRRLTDPLDIEHKKLLKLARESEFKILRETVSRLVAGFLLTQSSRGPLRLDNLSLAVAGDTKSLRPDTQDYHRLATALVSAHEKLARTLELQARGSKKVLYRLLFEYFDIVPNDTPLDILVQGPLTLLLRNDLLSDISRLARNGLPSKITYGALRACTVSMPTESRVISVENESAFHTLARHMPRDLLVYTAGQCSWPGVLLLRKLSEANPASKFLHAGDLDRSGLLILRSLRERTELDIRPIWMNSEVFEQCADLSILMDEGERGLMKRLASRWEEPFGEELVQVLAERGRWIEQEAVLQRCLS